MKTTEFTFSFEKRENGEVSLAVTNFRNNRVRADWDVLAEAARDELRAHGVHVTKHALAHNATAWASDYKSGCRDEANGVFVFTPCGCNGLRFDIEPLAEGKNWQITYWA